MKKPTLSIGIVAYNESQSIKQLLIGLKKQSLNSFHLESVIVVSDGSSDSTVEKVKEVKWNKIHLVTGKNRHGKPYRLNQIYRTVNTDTLVTLDADVAIIDKIFITKLAEAVNRGNELVSANATPVNGRTFLERAINHYYEAREKFRKTYDYSLTVSGFRGTALAYSRNFYKTLHLPSGIMNDDAYMFLLAKRLHLPVKQVKNAKVYFKSPETPLDFNKQMTRYIKGEQQLNKFFSADEMYKASYLPKILLMKISIYQMIKNPVGYMYLKLLLQSAKIRSSKANNMSVQWLMISSSKFIGQEVQL